MNWLNRIEFYSFLYEGLPQIYEDQKLLNEEEIFACKDCKNYFEREVLLDIAKKEEEEGKYIQSAEAYKLADRFGDYLRCIDKAIREAEEKGDYAIAALLAEQVASEDVVKTYQRLNRLKIFLSLNE